MLVLALFLVLSQGNTLLLGAEKMETESMMKKDSGTMKEKDPMTKESGMMK